MGKNLEEAKKPVVTNIVTLGIPLQNYKTVSP